MTYVLKWWTIYMEIYHFLSFIALKAERKCHSSVQLVEGSSRGRHRRGNRAAAGIFLDSPELL